MYFVLDENIDRTFHEEKERGFTRGKMAKYSAGGEEVELGNCDGVCLVYVFCV